jgi:hypothetical protein
MGVSDYPSACDEAAATRDALHLLHQVQQAERRAVGLRRAHAKSCRLTQPGSWCRKRGGWCSILAAATAPALLSDFSRVAPAFRQAPYSGAAHEA